MGPKFTAIRFEAAQAFCVVLKDSVKPSCGPLQARLPISAVIAHDSQEVL